LSAAQASDDCGQEAADFLRMLLEFGESSLREVTEVASEA
jgi:hypothetical protein